MANNDFDKENFEKLSDEELEKIANGTDDLRDTKPWQEEEREKYEDQIKKVKEEKNRRIEESKIRSDESKSKYFIRKYKGVVIALAIIAVAAFIAIIFFTIKAFMSGSGNLSSNNKTESSSSQVAEAVPKIYYDNLTGKEIVRTGKQYNADGTVKVNEDGSESSLSDMQAEEYASNYNTQPIFCIQTPNGMDGARPQISLNEASIVYEAIAEAGITRFAAIYKNINNLSAIGPIRSLRTYYLEWDTPYDCIIIHAGGEDGALEKVASHRHLSESTTYMWRDSSGYKAPNNLFTSGNLLNQFAKDKGYTTSSPKTFDRLTPDENKTNLESIKSAKNSSKDNSTSSTTDNTTTSTDESDSTTTTSPSYNFANSINVHYGNAKNFNVLYAYDETSNTYKRTFEGNSGTHNTYTCKNLTESGKSIAPKTECGDAIQISPDVVIVMKVQEQLNQQNKYREDITTTGTGDAWIFQDGIVVEATWTKKSNDDQISWTDKSGNVIKLAPGKTWISAIPKYASVSYN